MQPGQAYQREDGSVLVRTEDGYEWDTFAGNHQLSHFRLIAPEQLGQQGGYQGYDGDRLGSLTNPLVDDIGSTALVFPVSEENYGVALTFPAIENIGLNDTAHGSSEPVSLPTIMLSETHDYGIEAISPTYKELQGANPGFQAHHILPQYLGSMLGYSKNDMLNHPAMLVTQWSHTGKDNPDALHKAISNYLPPMVNGRRANYSADEIRQGLENAYNDIGHPELFQSIKHLIR